MCSPHARQWNFRIFCADANSTSLQATERSFSANVRLRNGTGIIYRTWHMRYKCPKLKCFSSIFESHRALGCTNSVIRNSGDTVGTHSLRTTWRTATFGGSIWFIRLCREDRDGWHSYALNGASTRGCFFTEFPRERGWRTWPSVTKLLSLLARMKTADIFEFLIIYSFSSANITWFSQSNFESFLWFRINEKGE